MPLPTLAEKAEAADEADVFLDETELLRYD